MSRRLHLYYHDGHSQVRVTDSDKHTVLYIAYRSSSAPHLTLCAATPGEKERLVGRVSFHHFKSKIDIDAVAAPLEMTKGRFLSSNVSVTGSGVHWKWERDGALTSNVKLIDEESGAELANFENASWSRSKQGTMTVNNWTPGWEVLDMIMLTGLAKVEYQRREQKKQAGGIAAANNHG